MYSIDQGIERDLVEAAKRYRSAASRGDPFVQRHLISMYARGFGVTQNLNGAARV
jgi:TPR repeat protein